MRILSFILLAASCVSSAFSQSRLYENEFPLSDVRLLDSPFRHAMELNTDILLSYDTDRLLAPYLKAAGLAPKGESFVNWDGLDGHIGAIICRLWQSTMRQPATVRLKTAWIICFHNCRCVP